MANPVKEHEELLRQHRFVLVSENKHRKYKDPEGRVYIVSKTPSDWRAWQNALTTLKLVIASPVQTSEVIEEERQRREIEKIITLTVTVKPLAGMSGAGKKKRQRGTGFIYEDKGVKSLAQIAHEERQAKEHAEYLVWLETPEGLEWRAEQKRLKEEQAEKDRLMQIEQEWKNQLRSFRKQRKQVEADLKLHASSLSSSWLSYTHEPTPPYIPALAPGSSRAKE